MAPRRRGRLYRGKGTAAREQRQFTERYGKTGGRLRRGGAYVYGATIGKVAREKAAKNPRGVKVERVRAHPSHSRTGRPERVRAHRAIVRVDPSEGYRLTYRGSGGYRQPMPLRYTRKSAQRQAAHLRRLGYQAVRVERIPSDPPRRGPEGGRLLPTTPRERFEHERLRSPSEFKRIRTVKVGEHEVRVGFRADGSSDVVSILHPKSEYAMPARGRMVRHRHSFGEHVGPCGPDCRAGRISHAHQRRRTRRRRR